MSIYTRPRRQKVDLVVGQAYTPAQLPFTAHGVIVYNHTDQHVLLVDENLFAPPKVSGWMMPIADAGSADIAFGAPPLAPDPFPTPGQVCTLIFTEEDVAPNPGVADGVINVVHPWSPCGTHTTVGTGAEQFDTDQVPIDAQQLEVTVNDVTTGLTGLSIVGNQSGVHYVFQTNVAFNEGGPMVVPINGAEDSTYHIAWVASGGAGIVVDAFESALPPGFPPTGQQPQSLSIPVVIANDQAIGKSGRQSAALSAPVVVQEEAGLNTFGVALAAGATLDLILIPASTICYLLQLNATKSSAAAAVVQLEDDLGNIFCRLRTDQVGELARPLRGVHPPANATKVRLHNTSGVAAGALDGEILFVMIAA